MPSSKYLVPLLLVVCFLAGRYSTHDDSKSNRVSAVRKVPGLVVTPSNLSGLKSCKNRAVMSTDELGETCVSKETYFTSSLETTPEVKIDQTLDEECQQFFSLLKFVDSWKSSSVPYLRGESLYQVSFTESVIAFDKREDDLYLNLEKSFERVDTARQRFLVNDSPENEVMLTCWLLLHGEFLTLSPVRRVASSLALFEEGEERLKSIEGWGEDQKEHLKHDHPAASLLLSTIKARNHVFTTVFKESSATLIAENRLKTELLSKYRTLLQSILRADTAFHLNDLEEAQKHFKEAAKFASGIKNDVVQFDVGRKPFLFVNEPMVNVKNPEPLDFIDNTKWSTIIPTIASLAQLRFLQKDRSEPQENLKRLESILTSMNSGQGVSAIAEGNPLGYFVRGLVQEEKVTLLLKSLLEAPQNTTVNLIGKINKTRQFAIDDLRKAQKEIALINAADKNKFVNDFDNSLVSLENDKSMIAVLMAIKSNANTKETRLFQIIDKSLVLLEKPDKSHLGIHDDLKSARHEMAWDKAKQYLLRHGTTGQAWRDYILTGIRTHQKSNLLKESYQLAKPLNVFTGKEDWQHAFLAGRIALYSGREILGEERQFIKALLLKDKNANVKENERLADAEKAFQTAIKHFDQSLARINANERKVDRIIIRSLRSQAGALRLLIRQEEDPVRLAEYFRDAGIGQNGLGIALANTPMSETAFRIDLQEGLAKAQQAHGILLILDGEVDQVDTALSALATSSDVIGRLNFEGGATLEQGTLLLSAIFRRNNKPVSVYANKDSRMRRVLQMLVEGLVMGDLGNPESGFKRIDQANTELIRKGNLTIPSLRNRNPSKDIWDLLYDDPYKIDLNSANKMVSLSSMLLQLEQSATSHSRKIGDILTPTSVDANETLASALTLISSDPLKRELPNVYQVLLKTRKPVESLALALAAESKARSLRLTEPEQRMKWIELSIKAVERSVLLQRETKADFNVKYPLLAQLRRNLNRRLTSSDYFLQRSKFAASHFRFDEAEERYRDGLAHHPEEQILWSNLASLIMTRLEVDDFAKELDKKNTIRVKKSLEEILIAWNIHRPQDRWERNLLQARFLVIQEKYADALLALNQAHDSIPANNKKAEAVVSTKRAEIAALIRIKKISIRLNNDEITQNSN